MLRFSTDFDAVQWGLNINERESGVQLDLAKFYSRLSTKKLSHHHIFLLPFLQHYYSLFSLKVSPSTTVREVVSAALEKFHLQQSKDKRLYFLTIELADNNKAQEGLTRKTLVGGENCVISVNSV